MNISFQVQHSPFYTEVIFLIFDFINTDPEGLYFVSSTQHYFMQVPFLKIILNNSHINRNLVLVTEEWVIPFLYTVSLQ